MVSIAFTGGGTGGHIYPGLAVASRIKKSFPCRIFWIGSSTGMDRAIVEKAGIEFFGIPSGKLRRYFSLKNISDIFRVISGFFAALSILKRERPRLLFSKGGFVSVPPCAAAKFLKIPAFTHESDFSPGLATRINSRFAEKIFIPYSESKIFYRDEDGERILVSGNPVRDEFAGADPVKGRAFLGLAEDERILLVLGGSLGSREINDLVKACLPELTRYYTVIHQTGKNNHNFFQTATEKYKFYEYFRDEIPHIIAAAELVLCRGGAGTIWECKSLHKPMILVPLSGSGTRGDQVENALLFEKAGAAVCLTCETPDHYGRKLSSTELLPAKPSPANLSRLVAALYEDSERRRAMGEAMITECNAAAFIADEIVQRIREG